MCLCENCLAWMEASCIESPATSWMWLIIIWSKTAEPVGCLVFFGLVVSVDIGQLHLLSFLPISECLCLVLFQEATIYSTMWVPDGRYTCQRIALCWSARYIPASVIQTHFGKQTRQCSDSLNCSDKPKAPVNSTQQHKQSEHGCRRRDNDSQQHDRQHACCTWVHCLCTLYMHHICNLAHFTGTHSLNSSIRIRALPHHTLQITHLHNWSASVTGAQVTEIGLYSFLLC